MVGIVHQFSNLVACHKHNLMSMQSVSGQGPCLKKKDIAPTHEELGHSKHYQIA